MYIDLRKKYKGSELAQAFRLAFAFTVDENFRWMVEESVVEYISRLERPREIDIFPKILKMACQPYRYYRKRFWHNYSQWYCENIIAFVIDEIDLDEFYDTIQIEICYRTEEPEQRFFDPQEEDEAIKGFGESFLELIKRFYKELEKIDKS